MALQRIGAKNQKRFFTNVAHLVDSLRSYSTVWIKKISSEIETGRSYKKGSLSCLLVLNCSVQKTSHVIMHNVFHVLLLVIVKSIKIHDMCGCININIIPINHLYLLPQKTTFTLTALSKE